MWRDRLFVVGMIDACERVAALVDGRDATAVEADRDVRDALLWNFTVLGEAANQVSEQTRAACPDVPWRRAIGMRNRIVHGYWSTDTDVMVSTARAVVPGLRAQLQILLDDLPETS